MANITINKDEINFITVTVSERQEIETPFYLFVLRSKVHPDEYRYFNSDDVSLNKVRYNKFRVHEKLNPDYTIGEVDLFTGGWTYKIYESATQTLNISDTTGILLETGLLVVLDDDYK